MRRRRFLAVACSVVAGCAGTDYRASGPRTLPPEPPTESSSTATVDPVESRAQAVTRPLNEVYRVVRGPLARFEFDDVSRDDQSAARTSLANARDAVTTFSAAVDEIPPRYRSLSTLVTIHEHLLDALTTAVELHSSLATLADDSVDDPQGRLDTPRAMTATLAALASDLTDVVETDPTMPRSVFLTTDRTRALAATLDAQSTAIGRLLDVVERELAASLDWRAGLAAFERAAFADARANFDTAREEYRAAERLLDGGLGTDGSFADLTDRRSCVATAGVEATSVARRAATEADAGDAERAARLLRTAESTRNRCSS
ncbi:hypothetical protein [Salinigranum marinum]|uniref:hypothetical protein n=1 Tax=Salinigranum marinum TaxID=1515595 RepID=UPI002989A632|nr:hypothetical protein [Salinigranum marinum]